MQPTDLSSCGIRRAGGPDTEQRGQSAARRDQIGKGVSIEHSQEGAERSSRTPLSEHALLIPQLLSPKHGTRSMSTSVRRTTVPRIDISGRLRQAYAAISTPCGLDITRDTQLMDDFHQVRFRDAIGVRDLGDRRQSAVIDRQIHQRSKRIISIGCQFHGTPRSRNAVEVVGGNTNPSGGCPSL